MQYCLFQKDHNISVPRTVEPWYCTVPPHPWYNFFNPSIKNLYIMKPHYIEVPLYMYLLRVARWEVGLQWSQNMSNYLYTVSWLRNSEITRLITTCQRYLKIIHVTLSLALNVYYHSANKTCYHQNITKIVLT